VDYVLFYKANFQFLVDALREGRLPLWNPYIGLGRPYLADTQNAVFYPPLYLICLGPRVGVFLLIWFHCALGVLGMRRLAGTLQAGRWQGYFMAFCFLASGALMARWLTGQVLYCCALCYLPWLFHYAARAGEPWQARRVACHALLLALQFLCGHPQVFYFSVLGQAAFILVRAMRRPVRAAAREAWLGCSQFAAACLWCAGLTAVVLLPFLELVSQGNRAAPSLEFVSYGKLTWADLGSLFNALGTSGPWIGWEMNLFVGVVVVVLGLAGLASVQDRNMRGLLAVMLVALFIAVEAPTAFFAHFWKWLPGFTSFRFHARAGALVVLVLACAAGVWLSRPHPKLKAAWSAQLALPSRLLILGLVLAHVANVFFADWQMKQVYTFANIMGSSPDYPFLETLRTQLREAGLMEPSSPPPRVCVPCGLVPANYAMVYRYSTFDAYTSLFIRRPWDYLHAALGLEAPALWNTSVAAGVYQHGPFPYAELAFAAGVDPSGTLLLAPKPAPRAFLAYAAEVMGTYDRVLAKLGDARDIHQCVLLEQPLAEALPGQSPLPWVTVPIHHFEPISLLLDVDAKTNALLVLAEAWYPGWKAEINGKVEDSLPANLWMRAFPVPPGHSTVRVLFHQNYLLPGTAVSSLSLAAAILAIFIKRRGLPAYALIDANAPEPLLRL
jgi:hypothetical protein